MADDMLERMDALLDDKLRPISAKLDEQSRKLERLGGMAPEPHKPHLKRLFLLVPVIAVVTVVVLTGRAFLAAPTAVPAPAAGKLLYADDFTDPAAGLFLDRQRGVGTIPPDRASAQWDYGYQDGALVAHVKPPTLPLTGRVIGGAARAANRLSGDFAFEVKAKATKSAAKALYGLRYFPGTREFGFGIQPSQKSYQVWELFQPSLLSARSNAIAGDELENFLRLEVRGNAIRLFVNGQSVDDLQSDAFGARPASVGLFFDTSAAPTDDIVEIRYTEFKVYSLGG